MKREAFNHSKIKRLARYLQVPVWGARGICESIWIVTEREAPRGDLGKLQNEDIALAIDWTEDPERLISALFHADLLDESEEHRIIVHDWSEHAPDGVHSRLAKAGVLFADGKRPKFSKLTQEERRSAESLYKGAEKRLKAQSGASKRTEAPASAEKRNAVPHLTSPHQASPDQTKPEKRTPASPRSADADAAVAYWQEKSGVKVRNEGALKSHKRRAEARLREGATLADLVACVDYALVDEFYVEKRYVRDPAVLWKNAERVAKLSQDPRAAPKPAATSPPLEPPRREPTLPVDKATIRENFERGLAAAGEAEP